MPTATAYDGHFPPEHCLQERYAQYEGRDGLLYKLRGGSGVFWCISGESWLIANWHTDPHLRVIR